MTAEKLVGVTKPEKKRTVIRQRGSGNRDTASGRARGQGEAGKWDVPQDPEGHLEGGQTAGVTGQGQQWRPRCIY